MIIYKLTSPSGKIYIGQTIKTLKYRFRHHCYSAFNKNSHNNSTPLSMAIRKYGKKKWSKEIIDRATTIDELNKKETYWITHFNTIDRMIGYNCNTGGDSYIPNEDTRKKISIGNRGKKTSIEAKLKMRNAKLGTTLSIEHRKKIGISLSGRKKTIEHAMKVGRAIKKPIQQLTINGVFIRKWDSATDASRELGFNAGHIRDVCRGVYGRKTVGGYKWAYDKR